MPLRMELDLLAMEGTQELARSRLDKARVFEVLHPGHKPVQAP